MKYLSKIPKCACAILLCLGLANMFTSCNDDMAAENYYTFTGEMMSDFLKNREDFSLFRQIVKTTFNQRRKVLRNSIRPVLADADNKARLQGRSPRDHSAFLAADIFGRRPEQLSVAEFVELTNAVTEEIGGKS